MILAIFLALFPSPTSAERAQIHKAVLGLSSRRFAEREQSAKRLMEFGPKARHQLEPAAKGYYVDAEVMSRAGAIIEKIVEVEVAALWPMPYADAFWYDRTAKSYSLDREPFRVQEALLDMTGRDGRPWGNYRIACESWVRSQVRNGAPVRLLRPMLAELHRRDAVFIGTLNIGKDEANPPVAVDWEAYARGK